VAAVSAVVRRLPRRAVLALGRRLGRTWGALDRRHREVAADNLRRAFPGWDESRVEATARGVYAHFGAVLLDLLWMEGRPLGDLVALCDFDGVEHLQAARAAGRGVLCPSAHFGNWELQAMASVPQVGQVSMIARALDNPALDRRLVRLRTAGGNTVIYKQKAVARVLTALRKGDVVAILIDQNVQAKDGIFVTFFGRPACTTTVVAALALKTGAAVVPVHCVLQPDGRYRMVYEPPVEWTETGRRDEDLAALTQRLTAVIETWVRQDPEQWLWLHRRWKSQPAPEPPSAASRSAEGHPRARLAAEGGTNGPGPSAPRSTGAPREHPENVLVRAPNWVGDVVLSLPALRDVRARFPTARLEVLARPWVAELYRAVPEVDAVSESGGHSADVAAIRGRFDLGLLLPNSFGTALVLWRAGVPERWGYATDWRGALLTRRCAVPPQVRGRSQVYYYRAMLEGLGLAVEGEPDASLSCPAEWAERGRALLGDDGPWIGVNPGAFYGTAKRWLPERFAAVADLVGRRSEAKVAIVGGAAERPLGEAIAGQLRGPSRVLCGETTLGDLVGVLARLRLLLTNDSGPMHLAAALGTPLVAVFGPTDWRETAPVSSRARLVREDVDCSPCLLRECPIDHRCMSRIGVDRVAAAALELLAS
jgi:lipopolysaccharide heptosyltransferase II